MAECAALRPDLLAYHDGEASPRERERIEAHLHTCQSCSDDLSRAAWEVGLLLLNLPRETPASGLSAGFTDRVMASVRAMPRTAAPAGPTAGPAAVPRRAPGRPVPPPPPATVPAGRILPWRTVAAAAALATAAAAALFAVLGGDPVPEPRRTDIDTVGVGSVVARNGGALRWKDRDSFDRGLAGSAWIAKDGAVPALPGEHLHSPAPSSIRVRLTGGGQLDAGPSSSLAFVPSPGAPAGGPGVTLRLLEGAVTASAGPGPSAMPLVIEAPGVRVETSGAVEVSTRVDGGSRTASRWFGARDAALGSGADAPAPPSATVLVFCREGEVLVATSSGPVRNSLERHSLSRGQALVLAASRAYLQRGVDDDAPPEGASAVGGLPIPPDSQYFRGGGTLATPGGGAAVLAAGPVRNSLERTLGDPTSDPEGRADALALFESMGGAEAVEAAVRAVDDPAVPVRCAAVRLLALSAGADRARALAALRRLAADADSGVAVFAIRALRVLEDRDALPVLRTLVVDDDAPPDEVQVAAFGALLWMGDTTRVLPAAGRLARFDLDSPLGKDLQGLVTQALERMPRETVRGFLADPRPGPQIAALLATRDPAAARAALGSPVPGIVLAGVDALLNGPEPVDLDLFRHLAAGGSPLRGGMITRIAAWVERQESFEIPGWLAGMARACLEDPSSNFTQCRNSVDILHRAKAMGPMVGLASTGTSTQRRAILAWGVLAPRDVLSRLSDSDSEVRLLAARALPDLARFQESVSPESDLLLSIASFSPGSYEECRYVALALMSLARNRGSEDALRALVRMSSSTDPRARRASATGLGAVAARPAAATALLRLLGDADFATAGEAAEQVTLASRRGTWSGTPVGELFPMDSPSSVVRVQMAQVARAAGNPEARAAVLRELEAAGSAARASILRLAAQHGHLLDFPVPAAQRDPSAAVRLRLLLATTGPARAATARDLAGDPSFWVQGAALAFLANDGDAAAAEALRLLVQEQREASAASAPLLRGLDPLSPHLPGQMLVAAPIACDTGSVEREFARPESPFALEFLTQVSRVRHAAATLRSSPNPAERAAAATSLGDLPVSAALEALAPLVEERDAGDPFVAAAVREAAGRLLGLAPRADLADWIRVHRRGYLGEVEIRARAGP